MFGDMNYVDVHRLYTYAFTQQLMGCWNTTNYGGQHRMDDNEMSRPWNNLYPGAIRNLTDAIENTKDDLSQVNINAALRIFRVYTGALLADFYGDVPFADAADYGEWKFQRRTTGLCLSAAVFAQKIGWSIGAALFGAIMTAVHFDATMGLQQIQNDSTIMNSIHWLFGILPGVLYASCAILLVFYNLDTKTMQQMKSELEQRNN